MNKSVSRIFLKLYLFVYLFQLALEYGIKFMETSAKSNINVENVSTLSARTHGTVNLIRHVNIQFSFIYMVLNHNSICLQKNPKSCHLLVSNIDVIFRG